MDALLPNQAAALERRRRQMVSITHEIIDIMREATNAGTPFLASPRYRSLLLQFEASRIRVEAYCMGEVMTNNQAVEALLDDGLCTGCGKLV